MSDGEIDHVLDFIPAGDRRDLEAPETGSLRSLVGRQDGDRAVKVCRDATRAHDQGAFRGVPLGTPAAEDFAP